MIVKYKQGICDGCGQSNLIVYKSGNLCYVCNIKRQSAKRKPIARVSKRGKQSIKADSLFYDEIWNARPHRCEECGTHLGDTLQRIYFSHIISKGSQPKLRRLNENINLLCGTHHRQWETGHRHIMRIYNANREIIQKLNSYDSNSTV